ncbi:hypothetical protein QCA50_001044 [Cerrena zonata]|uniref:ubiquitinyl hydrolase 1 n=1 Tax=Cerrena zonata TaxID=2478898 RepID=A0AAW0GT17_9APHY
MQEDDQLQVAAGQNEPFEDLIGEPFAVIESDPGVFTMLMRKLGIPNLEMVELYDIEPWAVDHLNPHGLIFCYVCPDDDEAESEDTANNYDAPDPDARDIWFANQLSNDSCASQALLNVIFNCRNIQLGPTLQYFYNDTEKMSWVMKGLAITNSGFICKAQNSLARPADLQAARHAVATKVNKDMKRKSTSDSTGPKKRKSSNSKARGKKRSEDRQDAYHFIGYVPCDGKVWELDGLRIAGPLEVGEISPTDTTGSRQGWMDIVRPALRLRMQRHLSGDAREQIRYNLLAIVDDQYTKLSDSLEMLKRERIALERRLGEQYPEGWSEKVNPSLLPAVREIFRTSVQSPEPSHTFATDFGSRKMERDMEILDMPSRNLPTAWDTCVQNAMSIKVSIEEELTKSRKTNTDFEQRTFDYGPFIKSFISSLQEDGHLQVLLKGEQIHADTKEPSNKATPKGKKRTRR